jgi:hypothetical protein
MSEDFKIDQDVIYTPTNEVGVVTSKNASFVFVRFGVIKYTVKQ